jgi:hypothetical protein
MRREPMTAERLAEIRASIERAHTEIGEVCAQGPRSRFRMSVPANPDRDTDLIVSDALKGAEDLLAEVDRLKADNTLLYALVNTSGKRRTTAEAEADRLSRSPTRRTPSSRRSRPRAWRPSGSGTASKRRWS